MKRNTLIIEIICYLYIFLFIYAAMMKLSNYDKFIVQLNQSPMLMAFSTWISWSIPLSELIIALLLLTSKYRLFALYAAFTMMVGFTCYIIIIINFAVEIPCSCGGILEKMGWKEHLIFNIAFILLSISAILLTTTQIKQNPNIEAKLAS